jgi:hypothetical protein
MGKKIARLFLLWEGEAMPTSQIIVTSRYIKSGTKKSKVTVKPYPPNNLPPYPTNTK